MAAIAHITDKLFSVCYAVFCHLLMPVFFFLWLFEGSVQQPSEASALQCWPSLSSAESIPLSQQAEQSAWQPGPAGK